MPRKYKRKRVYLDTNISLAYVAKLIGNEKLKNRIVCKQISKGREFYSALDNWLDYARKQNIVFSISPTILGETVVKIFEIMGEKDEWLHLEDKAMVAIKKIAEKSADIEIVQFGGLNDDGAKRLRFELFVELLDKIKDNEARSNYADRVILAFSASDPNSFGLLTNDRELLGDINKRISDTSFTRTKNNNTIKFIDYVQSKREDMYIDLKFHVTDNLEQLIEFIHYEESKSG